MSTERGASNVRRAPAAGRLRRPATDQPAPFIVGIVGPAGSGKTTLAHALAGPDVRVLDADRIGHDIVNGDPEVRAALSAEYGAGVYRADGTLDRARVAAKVFSDPAALARLNALTHPPILHRLRAQLAAAAAQSFTGTIVVDAALMLDWGFERECDAVLAVVAPRELQLARLMASRGWSADEARRRLERARSNDDFAALADEVIVNDHGEAEAVAAARAALVRLRAQRTPRTGGAA